MKEKLVLNEPSAKKMESWRFAKVLYYRFPYDQSLLEGSLEIEGVNGIYRVATKGEYITEYWQKDITDICFHKEEHFVFFLA